MIYPKAYEGKEPYIFISYAHKDTDRVLPIISALQNQGFRVWYDAGIEAGTEWPEYIAEHLHSCAVFLAFFSQSALDSRNCRQEVNFAIELNKAHLVVYLEDVKLSLGMQMRLGIVQNLYRNRHSSDAAFLQELCQAQILQLCRGAISCEDPEEYYRKGKQFFSGKKYTEAVAWYRKAAQLGHPQAQYALGFSYEMGRGITRNKSEAVAWYRKAADQGVAEAKAFLEKFEDQRENQYRMGKEYYAAKAYAKCVECFTQAAELGHMEAQYSLGNYFYQTVDNPYHQDNVQKIREAVKWYRMAAEQGHEDAQAKAGRCYEALSNYSEAIKWYHTAAERGNAEAQCCLGNIHCYGRGVEKDRVKAVAWYRKAADQGHVEAQCCMGICYDLGWGVAENAKIAATWFQKAARNGHDYAQSRLKQMNIDW